MYYKDQNLKKADNYNGDLTGKSVVVLPKYAQMFNVRTQDTALNSASELSVVRDARAAWNGEAMQGKLIVTDPTRQTGINRAIDADNIATVPAEYLCVVVG